MHNHTIEYLRMKAKKFKVSDAFTDQFYCRYTASNLGLLLQKEQNVKWGEGPSGKQAVGKTMEHGKLGWHIFNHK